MHWKKLLVLFESLKYAVCFQKKTNSKKKSVVQSVQSERNKKNHTNKRTHTAHIIQTDTNTQIQSPTIKQN